MKTTLFAALLMLIVSVSACKKDTYTCKSPCEACTQVGSSSNTTICREDLGSDGAYNAYLSALEAQGYSCVAAAPSDTETADSDDERRDLEDEGYVCTAD